MSLHTIVIELLASVRAQLNAVIKVLRRLSIDVDIHLITVVIRLLVSVLLPINLYSMVRCNSSQFLSANG